MTPGPEGADRAPNGGRHLTPWTLRSLARTTVAVRRMGEWFRHAASKCWNAALVVLVGEPEPAHIPARLSKIIAREQKQGELLIGWVQAVIVLTWTALYLISRKTFT